ncbi:MAG: serine hydrolase, partial [Patescibacteria group bacterium]|nr:serine hydrolase [Patescibacteria group bacterium]
MADLVRQVNLKRMPVNRKLIGWVFGITGVMSLFFWWRGGSRVKLVSSEVRGVQGLFEPLKISYTVEQKKVGGEWDASRTAAKLISQLRQKMSQAQGRYSVYVFRLDKKMGYGINEDEKMPAASIMKVPIMLAVMRKIEDGELKLDDIYVLRDSDKQSGSGPIEFMDAGTALTARQLVEEMMKKSDNTAPV